VRVGGYGHFAVGIPATAACPPAGAGGMLSPAPLLCPHHPTHPDRSPVSPV